ncbi:MAG TPA: DUF4331 family protein [Planctomycetota bacterium]|nr:DUF4331 family protein [Planctomycetota bacterium]
MKLWIRMSVLLAAAAVIPACGSGHGSGTEGASYKQIERLGRPAVNEGLVVTNDYLNAFNEIPPSADLSPAAAPVVTEAAQTLTAFGNSAQRVTDIATAFLPDVLRIDTTVASPVGSGAYASGAVPVGALGVVMPAGGRKIEDDVIDITLSVLTNGAITTDNVSYAGVGGNAAQPGHQKLHGQAAFNGAATFPFLAKPN